MAICSAYPIRKRGGVFQLEKLLNKYEQMGMEKMFDRQSSDGKTCIMHR